MKATFFTVYDKGRQIEFEGFHLSSASSYQPSKARWFTVDIYKTVGGKYIVAGVGKSHVVHREHCAQMKEKNVAPQSATKDAIPCSFCKPSLSQYVVAEVDREWAQVSSNPSAIIERLRLRDSDGVFYLPKTSTSAILAAAELDSAIKAAFYQPRRVD